MKPIQLHMQCNTISTTLKPTFCPDTELYRPSALSLLLWRNCVTIPIKSTNYLCLLMLGGRFGCTPCSAVQGQMAHLCLCSCVYASCVCSSWNAYQSLFSSCVLTSCSSLFACYLCRCCCCWSLCWGCCITLKHNSISSCQLGTTSKSTDQHGTVCYLRNRFVFRCDCFAAACSPFLPTAHCTVYTRCYKAEPAIHASLDLPFLRPLSALLSSLLVYVIALLVAAAALPSAAAISDFSSSTCQHPFLRLADGPERQVVRSNCSVRKGAARKVNKHCRFTNCL